MIIYAETERLILREILPTDIEGMFELDSNPEVHRYLGNNPVKDKNSIIDIIAFIRQQYQDFGIGRWAVVDKQTNDFIGWCGLKYIIDETNGHNHYYDLGYRLIQRYWGKGFATEAAQATLRYGFDKLELPVIYAIAACENEGSNNVLKKIGFTYIEGFQDDQIACNWYQINAMENLRCSS
ncbi:GNAT family N-acetyltransferase [Sphingobacterium oryzagri]|uniref:GNAT family N-acetyltransferase n=1 Tax=Sphingobacterium oryzagri TaxID=3025669 RepID=A0ABY7WND9_9SPHI|nr:GNAT family N-acetyltransferase [Sphingobacterium sp. KACC 22765]WDF70212.1 GNAT family N-acetyltransferase [Sphingobacterium sp. KACC 22765]